MVTREPADIEEDRAEWEQDICDELEEMQEQAAEEYQKKLEKYDQDLKLWKEQKLQKVVWACSHIMMFCCSVLTLNLALRSKQNLLDEVTYTIVEISEIYLTHFNVMLKVTSRLLNCCLVAVFLTDPSVSVSLYIM